MKFFEAILGVSLLASSSYSFSVFMDFTGEIFQEKQKRNSFFQDTGCKKEIHYSL